jgi:hypothetical protein
MALNLLRRSMHACKSEESFEEGGRKEHTFGNAIQIVLPVPVTADVL